MTAADVISELRAARPVAGEALRERVGELASRSRNPGARGSAASPGSR